MGRGGFFFFSFEYFSFFLGDTRPRSSAAASNPGTEKAGEGFEGFEKRVVSARARTIMGEWACVPWLKIEVKSLHGSGMSHLSDRLTSKVVSLVGWCFQVNKCVTSIHKTRHGPICAYSQSTTAMSYEYILRVGLHLGCPA